MREAEFAADPGGGDGEKDERNGIPVWSEERAFVPREYSAKDACGKPQEAENKGMQHGPIWSEPGRDVAAQYPVDCAIDSREQKWTVAGRLIPWRKDMDHVQHLVRAKREKDARDHASEHSDDASKNAG